MLNELNVPVTKVYRKNQKCKEKVVINQGGAGSSKSYSLCQFYIYERLFKIKGWQGLILRKTRHSNKLSTYKAFINILKDTGLYVDKNHNKSDMTYTVPELGTYVLFAGMDDREKIKSTQWHDIWLEEGNEFDIDDFRLLKNTRLYRGELLPDMPRPQVRISYNPVPCWINDILEFKDVRVIHSTYKDNPFCNKDYIETLEGLKNEDLNYYKIYCLGIEAELEGIIYKPFKIININSYPENDKYDSIYYGLDFGFNNPSALIQVGIDDKVRYLKELLYQTHLTNSDLIMQLEIHIPKALRNYPIYADNAEPNRIEEIRRAGFNCIPADKSVKDGIDFCKRQNYISCSENANLNKERSVYCYKKDKNGKAIEEPIKFKDHALDALRYADYTHCKDKNYDTDAVVNLRKAIKSAPQSVAAASNW